MRDQGDGHAADAEPGQQRRHLVTGVVQPQENCANIYKYYVAYTLLQEWNAERSGTAQAEILEKARFITETDAAHWGATVRLRRRGITNAVIEMAAWTIHTGQGADLLGVTLFDYLSCDIAAECY
ncbi:MAG: hypothetical protein NTNFB02_32320 [Nitrospira sp.]